MRANVLLLAAALACLAAPAQAFRDDLPEDMARDCVPGEMPDSAAWREECALGAIKEACAVDAARVPGEIARILGVSPLQVRRAHGRYTVSSLDRGSLCDRPERERRTVIASSYQAKKVRNESPKRWLLETLAGPDGKIDHAAVSRALAQREEILRRPTEKRAGLPASPAGWTSLTGYTQSPGRINHILFTSGTGTALLAGADGGGIWRSTDSGATWNAVNDFLGSLSITNFAKATNDANTIYAATNQLGSHTYSPFGILKSANGGVSWSQLASTSPALNADFTYVQRVAVHPTNSQVVLAATTQGAYQSIDGGTSWTKVGGITTASYFVAFHPTDGNRRAIAYNDGTVRYTTNGDLLGAGASSATVRASGRFMKIAYAKSDVNRMYAVVTDGSAGTTHLHMSVNGGGVWTEVNGSNAALAAAGVIFNSSYLSYTGGLWVDPLDADRVAVFEAWAGFTADISAPTPAWKALVSGWVDFHGIVEDPGYNGTSNKVVWFMDDGGLYRVTDVDQLDQFGPFSRRESGLIVTQAYSVSGHGGNIVFGAQDTGPKVYRTDLPGDATSKWRFTNRPNTDPLCGGCSWIGDGMTTAASTANPAVLYGSRQYLDLFRSTDGGVTSTSLAYNSALTEGRGATAPNFNASFVAPFVLDPSNQSRMLAGGRSLWRANDVDTGNPPTWTAIRGPNADAGCVSQAITHIAIAPSNPDVVWIAYACGGRLYKSVNATQASPAWTQVTTLPAQANGFRGSITIDRNNANIVWVGMGSYSQSGTLFKTTDGGTTAGNWSTVSGLPAAPVYALLQHPGNNSWLYAATGVGLFASQDGGATWSTSNEGPANVVVRSLDWNTEGASSELLVGTFGRGIWKATVSSVTLAASTTTMVSSVTSPAAPGPVTFTATVTGGSGTPTGNVVFRDGGVDLGTVALNGLGKAAFTTSSLAVGLHSITANYQGSATYAVSASAPFNLTIQAPNPARLVNISTRMQVLTGDDVMIGGFVIGGAATKRVAIVATGPSLAPFGIANPLADPTLRLVRSSDQAVLATNDNWQADANAGQLSAAGFAPSNSLEAALLIDLAPGAYTAVVEGAGNGTGVGVVAVYEVDHPEIPLINISTRGRVLTGNDVMIGGFVLGGAGPTTVAIVATGPSLAPFGIASPLANPKITLVRSSDQGVIDSNDDWQSHANSAQLQGAGFAPSNMLESGIYTTLQPGAYTVIVEGVGAGTGVAVVGVYKVN
jgi:hypothetical protein